MPFLTGVSGRLLLALAFLAFVCLCGFSGGAASALTVNDVEEEHSWRHEFTPDSPYHPIQREMLPFVEDMLEHAIDSYLTYGFPDDELKALEGVGGNGMGGLWMTLIDSLDTIAIMGRPRLFRRLAAWIEENASFNKDVNVSTFETNIRVVGGLIGAHFMYEEGVVPIVREEHDYDGGLLRLAVDMADRLIVAFDTVTGMPFGSVNLLRGVNANESLVTANACVGTYLLEMTALSRATGDPRYEAAARRASQVIFDIRDPQTSLMGNHVNIELGAWTISLASVGTSVDSTIEYWLKSHALSGEAAEWDHFERTRRVSSAFLREGGFYTQRHISAPSQSSRFFHCSLASFYPGCLTNSGNIREAAEVVWSTHGLFRYFGALPEEVPLSNLARIRSHANYPLRPEHLESIYHLYRATRDPTYLKMGREFALALNLRTRVAYGFASIRDVSFPHTRAKHDPLMESFVISETLKYLYLLFDECNVIHTPSRRRHSGPFAGMVCPQDAQVLERTASRASLVGWVFTTEAHTFPNHAEWYTPGSASADRRPMPNGLVGSPFSSTTDDDKDQGFALPLVTEESDGTVSINPPKLRGPPPSVRSAMKSGTEARTATFVESATQTRYTNLLAMHRTFFSEVQVPRVDMQDPAFSYLTTLTAKHRYYCENHPVHGLDRLSRSVYREMMPSYDY